MASRMAPAYRVAKQVAERHHISLCEAEYKVLGVSHAEVGAYLLGLWGLPWPSVEAVAHHHRPERLPHEGMDVILAVATANMLAQGYALETSADSAPGSRRGDNVTSEQDPVLVLLAQLGMAPRLKEWTQLARRAAAGLGMGSFN